MPPRTMLRSDTMTRPSIRRGFTLPELLIATVLMLFVFAMVVPFMRVQTWQIGASAARLDALQNARFSQNAIDRELRIAGVGATPNQPMLVQADPMALTFNADLATTDSTDPDAIYYDPYMDTLSEGALPLSRAITLPRSTTSYPLMSYQSTPGIMGTAETVSYWLSLDSTSKLANVYVLWRRANDQPATAVSTGIYVAPGTAFFQYYKIDQVTGALDSIPNSKLPLFHAVALHHTPADTGAGSLIDSLRAVNMKVIGVYNDTKTGPVYRTVQTTTKLLNVGLLNNAAVCGPAPLPIPTAPVATVYGTTPDSVTLTWSASPDQNGGLESVQRYLIYRTQGGQPMQTDPAADVAAGLTTYEWKEPDFSTMTAGTWTYTVIAQDCTPTNSTTMTSNSITLP
jgi:prepilin-type N-terminal cleavage/methylation domain-containing protein